MADQHDLEKFRKDGTYVGSDKALRKLAKKNGWAVDVPKDYVTSDAYVDSIIVVKNGVASVVERKRMK